MRVLRKEAGQQSVGNRVVKHIRGEVAGHLWASAAAPKNAEQVPKPWRTAGTSSSGPVPAEARRLDVVLRVGKRAA